MNLNLDTDPIGRLRRLAADRAKVERQELLEAYREAIAEDIRLTENQRQELEKHIADHARWITQNSERIEALRSRNLAALSTYESKCGLYQNQIGAVLAETKQISVNSLWGVRSDGQRDPAAYKAVVSGVKSRLGQCRGLAGALHRCFLAIGVELAALERRGYGQPPSPAPLTDPPPAPGSTVAVILNDPELKTRSKR